MDIIKKYIEEQLTDEITQENFEKLIYILEEIKKLRLNNDNGELKQMYSKYYTIYCQQWDILEDKISYDNIMNMANTHNNSYAQHVLYCYLSTRNTDNISIGFKSIYTYYLDKSLNNTNDEAQICDYYNTDDYISLEKSANYCNPYALIEIINFYKNSHTLEKAYKYYKIFMDMYSENEYILNEYKEKIDIHLSQILSTFNIVMDKMDSHINENTRLLKPNNDFDSEYQIDFN